MDTQDRDVYLSERNRLAYGPFDSTLRGEVWLFAFGRHFTGVEMFDYTILRVETGSYFTVPSTPIYENALRAMIEMCEECDETYLGLEDYAAWLKGSVTATWKAWDVEARMRLLQQEHCALEFCVEDIPPDAAIEHIMDHLLLLHPTDLSYDLLMGSVKNSFREARERETETCSG